MAKEKKVTCCASGTGEMSCCHIEAIVSVDERGQMVLPKELRDKAGIKPGDKLAVVGWDKDGQTYCFTLMKTNAMADMVKDMLGPLSKEIFG
jgi:antitoxin PrlF